MSRLFINRLTVINARCSYNEAFMAVSQTRFKASAVKIWENISRIHGKSYTVWDILASIFNFND